MTTPDLRPLGIGELLDRAVTLAVRNAGILLLSIALVYIPFSLLEWALSGDGLDSSAALPLFSLDTLIGLLMFAYGRTVWAIVIASRYAGKPVALRTALLAGARRYGAQLVALLAGALAALGVVAAAGSVFIVLVLLVTGGHGGTVAPVFIRIPLLAALVPLCVWVVFAYHLATVRIALGRPHPFTIVFAMLAVTAFRAPWRSLLCGALAIAGPKLLNVAFTATAIAAHGSRYGAIPFACGVAGMILGEALSVALVVVYDVDLAVRTEGADIGAALEATRAS